MNTYTLENMMKDGEDAPDDMATIDHVHSRFNREKGEESPKVLACHPCNLRRSRQEAKTLKKLGLLKSYERNPHPMGMKQVF
jgi:hypothetical protein